MHTPETRPSQLALELTVGNDTFSLKGEFTLAEAMQAFKEWAALIGGSAGQGDIDALAGRLKQSTDTLQTVVDDTTKPKET